ncbi:paraquat-inducible protein A [Acinetobacter boissieri]|uniref:Paraquat-inducible protein A n=1 Tax=Acinetobacter boissieri TaxID=1219383 RepID=A0A1G6HIE9_9GAMM|nr:paraquat-inducible protein A [Acinetobacter boissieri]SDB93923.1 paraquat-inducible protein A [Acinetobacter boissieri]
MTQADEKNTLVNKTAAYVPHDLTQFASCEECDTLYHKVPLAQGEKARCLCCGAEIYKDIKPFSTLIALVLTALIIFIVANSFPIIKVEVQGNSIQTTLLGAAWTMFEIDRAIVGIILILTTFIVPLVNLILLMYVFVNVGWFKRRPYFMLFALRTLYLFRVWAMVEVFLIGILVTLVKLISMVIVIPEIALWGFALLSIFMVYLNDIKVQDTWDAIDRYLP